MPDIEWLRQSRPGIATPVVPHFTVDNDDWRASIERVEVSPTLHVTLTDAAIHRDLSVELRGGRSGPLLASQIVIEGRADMALGDGVNRRARRRTALLFRPPEHGAVYSLKGGTRLVMASYAFAIDSVSPLLEGDVPEPLLPLLERTPAEVRCLSHPASPTLRAVAAGLFAPGFNGPLRRLMIEGTALNLLALQAAAVARLPVPHAAAQLTSRERAAAVEARRLLLADMRSTPSLGALATAVDLGRKRLNVAFRRMFGATVFELLQRERLEHARLALEQGGISLKQAAFGVGYDHVTNFIIAFRARYGAPPAQFFGSASSRSGGTRPRRWSLAEEG